MTNLTGDDAMAFSFLSRAANAIVAASDLSTELSSLREELSHIREHRDTLDEIKRQNEERIGEQCERISSLCAERDNLSHGLFTIAAERDARQHDINLLDERVAGLLDRLTAQTLRADAAEAKSALLSEALDGTISKLNAVRHAMGQGDLEPDPRVEIEEAAKTPEPEPSLCFETHPSNFGNLMQATEDMEANTILPWKAHSYADH